jgi:hypothetical protein
MSLGGAISMTVSLLFVFGLALFCYLRVLRAPPPVQEKEKDELEHFHSA